MDSKKTLQGVDEDYNSDGRSGDEVTDSELEFDRIVKFDQILNKLHERTIEVGELHT